MKNENKNNSISTQELTEIVDNMLDFSFSSDDSTLTLAKAELILAKKELWQSLSYEQGDLFRNYMNATKHYYEMAINKYLKNNDK